MVVIDPFGLRSSQKRGFDELAAQGSHGDMSEAQEWLVTKIVGSLNLMDHNYVYVGVSFRMLYKLGLGGLTLNANTEVSFLVVPGFYHAC